MAPCSLHCPLAHLMVVKWWELSGYLSSPPLFFGQMLFLVGKSNLNFQTIVNINVNGWKIKSILQ